MTASRRFSISWLGVAVLALVGSLLVVSPAVAAYSKSAPTGLKATDVSNTSIAMTWKRISGVNRYAIQYSTSSRFSNPKYRVPTGITAQSKANTSINGLKPSTRYYFRIRATTDGGKNLSDWSKSYNRTTSTYVYGAPSAPKASNQRASSVNLNWSETPNAGNYRVRYAPKSGAGAGRYLYTYPISNSVTLTDLRKNTSYKVQVRALEGKVDEKNAPYLLTSYSKESSFSTSEFTTAPASGLAVTSASLNKIQLQWDKVTDADAYRIQYWTSTKDKRYLESFAVPSKAPGTAFDISGDKIKATVTRFCNGASCSSFSAGKTYRFRVTALKSGKRINDYTAASGVGIVASSKPLSYPMNLRVESATNSTIQLSWPVVPGAASYYLQSKLGSTSAKSGYTLGLCTTTACKEQNGRMYVTLARLAGSAVKGNSTYYVRIVSADASNTRQSEYSTSYTKATTARFKYAAPVMGGSTPSTYGITVSWRKIEGAAAYAIERSSDAEFKKIERTVCVTLADAEQLPQGDGTVVLRTTVGKLSSEHSYFFRTRVSSSCSSGYSAQSENSKPVSARTQARVGSITGTVTRGAGDLAGFDNAVKTMVATAYAGSCGSTGYDVASTTRVKSDGSWILPGLRGGSYCVLLSQVGDANFTSPWVRNGAQWNSETRKFKTMASTITVSGTAATSAGDVPIGPGEVVSGTLRGQKADGTTTVLGDATITLTGGPMDGGSEREVRAVTITGDGENGTTKGAYSVNGLFPGKYRVNVVKSGYIRWAFWVKYIQNNSTLNIKICGTASCKASPGATTLDR